jgi:hypothetical protein
VSSPVTAAARPATERWPLHHGRLGREERRSVDRLDGLVGVLDDEPADQQEVVQRHPHGELAFCRRHGDADGEFVRRVRVPGGLHRTDVGSPTPVRTGATGDR